MELFRLEMPDDKNIESKNTYNIDSILPISLANNIKKNEATVLFFACDDSKEKILFFETSFFTSDDVVDTGFIQNHSLNIINIKRNSDRLDTYNNYIKDLDYDSNLYETDLDMINCEDDKDKYYFKAARKIKDKETYECIEVTMSKILYIKISLFATKFLARDMNAHMVFLNKKLDEIEFQKVTGVKLDGSAENKANGLVYSHYTLALGPAKYRMNFISPIMEGKLKHSISSNNYMIYYGEDFTIHDIIRDFRKEILYIIYEYRSGITNQYMGTKVLVMDKSIYTQTNFADLSNIYDTSKPKNIISLY